MKKEHVPLSVSFHDAVPVSRTFDHTAKAFPLTGTLWLKVAVGVVDMKDGQPSLGRGIDAGQRREQTYS